MRCTFITNKIECFSSKSVCVVRVVKRLQDDCAHGSCVSASVSNHAGCVVHDSIFPLLRH